MKTVDFLQALVDISVEKGMLAFALREPGAGGSAVDVLDKIKRGEDPND